MGVRDKSEARLSFLSLTATAAPKRPDAWCFFANKAVCSDQVLFTSCKDKTIRDKILFCCMERSGSGEVRGSKFFVCKWHNNSKCYLIWFGSENHLYMFCIKAQKYTNWRL